MERASVFPVTVPGVAFSWLGVVGAVLSITVTFTALLTFPAASTTDTSKRVPAFWLGIVTLNVPFVSALAVYVFLPIFTLTVEFASALPVTVFAASLTA